MKWARRVEPEILDVLPATDSEAQHSRRDLYRVNRIMLNDLHMAAALKRVAGERVPAMIVDCGTGDGRFMLRVASKLVKDWPHVHLRLMDRQPCISAEVLQAFEQLGWTVEVVTADILPYLDTVQAEIDIVTVNLFLHHFTDEQLQTLCTSLIQRVRGLVAIEPQRSRVAWGGTHLLGLVGCNQVTRHDAKVSVRAGFSGQELSAHWPDSGWLVDESWMPPFSHGFLARRVE